MLSADQGRSVPNELKYGDQVHLQNGYNTWAGGCLDTNGHATADRKNSGGKYNVSTAKDQDRAPGLRPAGTVVR
ncbi:hypothetical protein [Streptomyces sp. AC627_RSS907]|uniref:hypothetical protein n=1 Tax=Streptomyces sp. AC627_RSS907 TaxID=2823684 RepID=UPI001C22CD50|nr:hypothetical protein [Streptomyces sp. AC627_RSS907]